MLHSRSAAVRSATPLNRAISTPLAARQRLDLERARAVGVRQRTVLRDRHRVGGERVQPHLAAQAVRSADPGDADAFGHERRDDRQVAAAAALAAAAAAFASAAALAASSARALRSLRGTDFSGLLRFSRVLTPASSRKRDTRSVGSAPLSSQALHLSRSSLQPLGLVLRQQRIEVAEPLDEAAVARRAASRR